MGLLIAPLVALLATIWAFVVRRRARLPAEIRIVDPEGAPSIDADGAARSVQAAELTIPTHALVELWSPACAHLLAVPRTIVTRPDPRQLQRARSCRRAAAAAVRADPFRPAALRARRRPRCRPLADPQRGARLPPPGRRTRVPADRRAPAGRRPRRLPDDPHRDRGAQLLPGDRQHARPAPVCRHPVRDS